jgi:serine/threonine protein kinase
LIKKIGKYDIVGLIARGGFSDVYLAMEPSLDVQVAIKVFAAEHTPVESESAWRQRFLQESKMLHSLSSAPHIVNFMEFGFTEDQKPYIVMPYYKRTLADLLGEDNRLSQNQCLQIAKQVLHALEAIHKVGILHLDIKPSNLLIDDHEQVQIADFGVSELLNEPNAHSTQNVSEQTAKFGSQYFASPEQVAGTEKLNAASDIYSLAAVLFRCFTGKHKHINTDLPKIGNQAHFLTLLAKVLENDPNKRPQNAAEFSALVNAFERNQELESGSAEARYEAEVDENATQLLSGLQHGDNQEANGLTQLKHDIVEVLRKHGYLSDFDFRRLSLIAKATLHDDFETFDLKEYISIVERQLKHNEPAFARFVLWLEQVEEQIKQEIAFQIEKGIDVPKVALPEDVRDNLLQLGLAVLPNKTETHIANPNDMHFDKATLEKLIEDSLKTFQLNKSHTDSKSASRQKHTVKPRLHSTKRTFISIGVALFVIFIAALVPNINEFGEEAATKRIEVQQVTRPTKAAIKEPVKVVQDNNAISGETAETSPVQEGPMRVFPISFNIQPADAMVSFQAANGEMVSPEQLIAGNYTVRISKTGYLTEKQSLVLDDSALLDKVVTISANLTLSNSRYFIGETDLSVADGTPVEFILLPKIEASSEQIRMMSFEVTNELYQRCIDDGECLASNLLSDDPRQVIFEQADHPVVNVSWFDITDKFIPWLTKQTHSFLRLPTEQEWIHAASVGQATNRYSWGESFRLDQAHCRDCYSLNWRGDDYRFSTRPVMSFFANQWQLFDLHGNVQEWTSDCVAAANTSLQERCDQAIVKGGSWFTNHVALSTQAKQALQKNARSHTTGFRLVEVLEPNMQTGPKDEE